MPRSVSVTQFRAHTGRYARLVRDTLEPIDITLRGEVVARLVPAPADEDAIWAEMDELAAEIGKD